jgi:hypothetical protein
MLKNPPVAALPRRAPQRGGPALWQGGDSAGAERAFRAAIDAALAAPAFGNLAWWCDSGADEGLAPLTRAVELDPRHQRAAQLGNPRGLAGA